MVDSIKTRKKRFIGLVLVVAVVALAAVSLLLCFLFGVFGNAEPLGSKEETMPAAFTPTDIESEYRYNPESGAAPLLEGGDLPSIFDVPGVIPASGEFDVDSVQKDVNVEMAGSDGEFATIIEAIKSADPAFDPEGYRAFTHVGTSNRRSGTVWVTLYIGDIETSSSCLVHVEDGAINYVQTIGIYHPDSVEVEQVIKLRADFEDSAAGKAAIERTKAAMWPAGSTATPDEYSEEYYFDFQEDKLYLTITDDRRQDGVIVAKQERIDCLEVLGR